MVYDILALNSSNTHYFIFKTIYGNNYFFYLS